MMKSTLQLSLLLLTLVSFNVAAQTQECNRNIVETAPASRFIFNTAGDGLPDGTVSDQQTGLMWAQCPQGFLGSRCDRTSNTATSFTWSQALSLTQATSDRLNRTDWRLPNVKELQSLVERRCSNPAINAMVFPNTLPTSGSSFFWSASPITDNTNVAWGVFFDNGNVYVNSRSNGQSVRLVRGGQ